MGVGTCLVQQAHCYCASRPRLTLSRVGTLLVDLGSPSRVATLLMGIGSHLTGLEHASGPWLVPSVEGISLVEVGACLVEYAHC